ncbi:hypothetical protein H6G33_24560 [Calothrix sp. FACHB-1219]|uniref:hypothetical protein n=1 Tax=unclassified Calothrix TaxID=2619626 RepID=UPI0016824263|nr:MULTISPECIES: hypothetical protein [unclassified Calothrix]MBD2205518.1 hypothetical protein [Calothrix sp. FACHB-168]MBD2220181.1 hypothetical protein [Calothrix sp. FACHB-1219]
MCSFTENWYYAKCDRDRLKDLIEVISRHHLGLKNTNADVLGETYEYLLRKLAEG